MVTDRFARGLCITCSRARWTAASSAWALVRGVMSSVLDMWIWRAGLSQKMPIPGRTRASGSLKRDPSVKMLMSSWWNVPRNLIFFACLWDLWKASRFDLMF